MAIFKKKEILCHVPEDSKEVPTLNHENYKFNEKTLFYDCIYEEPKLSPVETFKTQKILDSLTMTNGNGELDFNAIIQYYKLYFNSEEISEGVKIVRSLYLRLKKEKT